MKMSFICMRMKNHFLVNGFTLGLTYGLSHLKIAHDLILGPDCNTPDLSRVDVRHLISDVCQMSELSCQKSDVTCLMSDVWCQIFDIRPLISDIIHHTSDVWHQPYITHQTSVLSHETSDIRCLVYVKRFMSDVWCVTCVMYEIRCLTAHVWSQMSDVRRLM